MCRARSAQLSDELRGKSVEPAATKGGIIRVDSLEKVLEKRSPLPARLAAKSV
jgi:hypothetical protein